MIHRWVNSRRHNGPELRLSTKHGIQPCPIRDGLFNDCFDGAGTTGPGSTHLAAGLYEAARNHAPVLALSGDMPLKMQGVDYIQTTKPDLLFRDVSLYAETITSPDQAPAVIHQAIAAAYAGRGGAHLTLPQDVIAARTDGGVVSVDTLQPRPDPT